MKIYTIIAKNNSNFLNREKLRYEDIFHIKKGEVFNLQLGNEEAIISNSKSKSFTLRNVNTLLRFFSIPGVPDDIVIRNFATVDLRKKRGMVSIWR